MGTQNFRVATRYAVAKWHLREIEENNVGFQKVACTLFVPHA